ncbi:tRNA pseudouridine(55) synthase TruB [Candidatus Raskinella chloraquaticus]|uniref:tRNA pseudouridine synthase B n=1 Tax=Candidatus Raskinella chloraquaticus TaxID=1951219 RepID=A0A1W9HQ07_9HYPH|nr:MAG: tRNA pseudouridine(55) synthase [Proteobacteria bacterium SG_bin8]
MNAPRRIKRDIDGWIILDKPTGTTSTQAVGAVRWALSARKAGHAGTLDPLATGVLPIALGEATKTVAYVMDGQKRYRFTVTWGQETDTDDSEGKVVRESALRPTREAIMALLPRYTGTIEQVPPQFSAIKIQGERAYDLAREGESVTLVARQVNVYELTLADMPDDDHAVFECECGKGTYVRSLARDIGRDLGCLGHVSTLRRTQVGDFRADEAVSLEAILALREHPEAAAQLRTILHPIAGALADLPHIAIDRHAAERLRRGQAALLRGRDAPIIEGEAYATCHGELIAIGTVEAGMFQPSRVFRSGGIITS